MECCARRAGNAPARHGLLGRFEHTDERAPLREASESTGPRCFRLAAWTWSPCSTRHRARAAPTVRTDGGLCSGHARFILVETPILAKFGPEQQLNNNNNNKGCEQLNNVRSCQLK